VPHQCAVAEDGISGAGGAGQAPFELECTPNGEYGRHSRDWRLIGLKHRVGELGSALAERICNDFDAVFAAAREPALGSAGLADDLHHAIETIARFANLRTHLAQLT
jgi:hypothetical protein